jgi:hypothetical protein
MSEQLTLAETLSLYTNDPYKFVLCFFPWGEPESELEKFSGPEPWQRRVLIHIRDELAKGSDPQITFQQAVQVAIASGHGVGKSALVSWLILWAITTFPDTKGVVTANTETQLKTKTWAELGKWHRMLLYGLREYFKLTATALFSSDPNYERTWRIDMVPWSERNQEAFAGLHNKSKRILLLMDEASAIPDQIWETAEGALTDANTQILWIVCGNPTRNTGRFRECFGRYSSTWWNEQVDSRTVSITNKEQFKKWIRDYGDDSDFVRVRVRGVFPRAGSMQFIPSDSAEEAGQREISVHLHDPLVFGVDVARFGDDESVVYIRKGRDGRSNAPLRFRGLDTMTLASKVCELFQQFNADAIFVDGGGVGGGVVDRLRQLRVPVYDIQFGSKPTGVGFAQDDSGTTYANKRAEMWGSLREWLKVGSIPDDRELRDQLIGVEYGFNVRNEIQLERKEDMKKRGQASPDIADALALTFALPVARSEFAGGEYPKRNPVESEYDPFAPERMEA